MPRVPDRRVGVCNRVGLLVGVGSTSKQCMKQPSQGCMLTIEQVRGWIRVGKFYIWVARI